MITYRIDLTGASDLVRKFKASPRLLRQLGAAVAEESAHAVERRAQAIVPVKTGALRRAIRATGAGSYWFAGVIPGDGSRTDPARYAPYVEYGFRAFMRPAIEAEKQRLPARVERMARRLEVEVRAA